MFTVVSTIVGGGIVGLPYAIQQMGLYCSSIIMVIFALHQLNTSWLYISSKDLIEGKPESIYEIGYMLF
jgi:amino acid permease